MGSGRGRGSYVVNRQTGAITAHPSHSATKIGNQYDEAIRTGRPVPGRQVYPHTWRVQIDRTQETSDAIQYRVRIESLAHPPATPPTEHQLTIDKRTFHHYTDNLTTHPACTQAMGWAAAQSRQNGTWPHSGTFEF